MIQTTACNAHHSVEERCVRWLLMAHDQMHRQDFTLSHEFLAEMLGANRSTVSEVAGKLRAAGLIRYSHGRVTVVDPKGLEAASCERYAALHVTSTAYSPADKLTTLPIARPHAKVLPKPTDRDSRLLVSIPCRLFL